MLIKELDYLPIYLSRFLFSTPFLINLDLNLADLINYLGARVIGTTDFKKYLQNPNFD